MMEITDDTLKILFLLRKNPRRSFLEISIKTGIPLEKIFQTYNQLKSENMLKTYTILSIPEEERYINVFVILSRKEELLEYLKRIANINSISITDREYLLHCSFLNLREYNYFLDILEQLDAMIINDYFINNVIE